jgi:hypothetical protein
MIVRSNTGKFITTGGEKIGEHIFHKKGFDKGKQLWKCIDCKKRTYLPEMHCCD